MKNKFLFLIIFFFTAVGLSADPIKYFDYTDYLEPISLMNSNTILLNEGDNDTHKNLFLDDLSWYRVSFPLDVKKVKFNKDENTVYWYRFYVKFPDSYPDTAIGITLGKISDIDETYFNGTLIGSSGDFNNPKSHACNKLRIYEIPSKLIIPGKLNTVAIKIRNTYRADELPGRGIYKIDKLENLLSEFYINGFTQLFFSVIYIGLFCVFFLLYYKRTKEIENLFYSIFSLLLAVYSFSRLDIKYIFTDNFNVMQKIEFGSLYLLLMMFLAFILHYYKYNHRIIHYVFYALNTVSFVVVMLMQDHLSWYKFNISFVQYTWLIAIGTWIYILAKEFRTNRDARLMSLSSAFVIAGATHDLLLSRGIQLFEYISFWIAPYAFFLFVISMAAIIATRMARVLTEVEDLNMNLEQKVLTRTAELNEALKVIQIKDDKIQKELKIAGNVQKTLLPKKLPDWKQFRLCIKYQPLREVSGDFYELFDFSDGGHGVIIADASGHGMPAAIYTILAKSALYKRYLKDTSPSEIFKKTNEELCEVGTGQYFTAFMVKLTDDDQLIYANAGHTKAIVLNKELKRIKQLDTPGTFIGAMIDADSSYQDASLKFKSGDKVILFTDALEEGTNSENEEYGEMRILNSVKNHFFEDIDTLIESVMTEYFDFIKSAERKDDLTVIGIEHL